MFGSKIRLSKDLYEKIKKYSQIAGYSSPEEFVVHALEKEIAKLDESEDEEIIKERLKGLGYIS